MIADAEQAEDLLAALTDAAARFDALARRIGDRNAAVRGSTWTMAEVVAHVVGGLEAYARYLDGDDEPALDVSDVAGGSLAASNAELLAGEPERAIGVLLDRGARALDHVIVRSSGRPLSDEVPWHGCRVPLRCFLANALGEQLLHGRDLARSIGAPWSISRGQAVLVLDNVVPLLRILVDRRTTAGLDASIRIVLRGGSTISLTFDDGIFDVGGHPQRFDATVSADPVAFLLVAYGRVSQRSQIARGRLLAWGRRPWLALRLPSYFVHP